MLNAAPFVCIDNCHAGFELAFGFQHYVEVSVQEIRASQDGKRSGAQFLNIGNMCRCDGGAFGLGFSTSGSISAV